MGIESLTNEERKVLRLIHQRVTSTKEIARRLDKAEATVKAQVASAMRRLDTTSRFQAAAVFAAFEEDNPEGIKPSRMIDREATRMVTEEGRPSELQVAVREERVSFEHQATADLSGGLDQRVNSLSMELRVIVIATMVIAVAVVVLLIVPTSERAQWAANRINQTKAGGD